MEKKKTLKNKQANKQKSLELLEVSCHIVPNSEKAERHLIQLSIENYLIQINNKYYFRIIKFCIS